MTSTQGKPTAKRAWSPEIIEGGLTENGSKHEPLSSRGRMLRGALDIIRRVELRLIDRKPKSLEEMINGLKTTAAYFAQLPEEERITPAADAKFIANAFWKEGVLTVNVQRQPNEYGKVVGWKNLDISLEGHKKPHFVEDDMAVVYGLPGYEMRIKEAETSLLSQIPDGIQP